MKKIALFVIVTAMVFYMCSCSVIEDGQGNVVNTYTGETTPKRFITVYEQNNFSIIADMETKVQYLVYHGGYSGGISILVEENGNPILYDCSDCPFEDEINEE